MRDQLVTETIDARILRLVSLEDVFDLDYETYLVLLKEAQVKGKNTLPAEEQAILANERKRVRGKVGRFKPKAKTINVNSITSVGRVGQKLLPGARGIGSAPIVKSLASIGAIVESISENLSDQSKEDKKESEENRKSEENARRKKKEESLESSAKKVMAAAKKLFAPVRGIFDAIYNYLFYTFLGRGINEALNWLSNPENKTKLTAIGKFIGDFWPALLGTAVAFFTPLGNFIRTTLAEIAKLGFRFPLVAAATGVTILGELGAAKMRKVTGDEYRLTGYEGVVPGVAPGRVPDVKTKPKTAAQIKENQEAPYGRNPDGSPKLFPNLFASGGFIDQNTGLRISGAGADTQLTALQPGEVVMNRAAVRAVGVGNLLNLNRMFGGPNANKPRFSNNIQLAQGGGLIGRFRGMFGGNNRQPANNISSTGIYKVRSGRMVDPITGMTPTDFKQNAQRNSYQKPNLLQRFLNWYNKGRNVRIPNENRAGWRQLIKDDISQRGKFQTSPGQFKGWNPAWSFSKGLNTGPTPMGRQFVERSPKLGMRLAIMPVIGDMLNPRSFGSGDLQSAIQRGDYRGPMPGMPMAGRKPNVITLPPTVENAPSTIPQKSGGSEVPSFSATAPGNRRMENAQIYGIVQ